LKVTKDTWMLLPLGRELAANNLKALLLFSGALIVDGVLIALVATTIAPIADYFLDPNFMRASAITLRYIEIVRWIDFKPGLEVFLSIFVIANLMKASSSALLHYLNRHLAYLVVHDIALNVLRAIMSSSLCFFLSYPLGKLQNTLQREVERLGDGIVSSLTITATLLQLLLLAYVAWMLSHNMVVVSFVLVLLFVLITKGLNSRVLKFASLTVSTSNEVSHALLETLMGSKTILAYARGQVMLARYSKTFASHARAAVISQTLQNGIPAVYQAFGFLAVSMALYVSVNNGENIPTLVAALWTLMRMVPLFAQLLGNIGYISNVVPSFIQYRELVQAADKASVKGGELKFLSFTDCISMNGVCFDYPTRGRALSDINIVIPKGSFTAFVGESGSGKTTAMDILLRLLTPNSGTVLIDKIPLQDYEVSSFLERVGYVPQESFLFNASIRENLLWSYPTASDEDLWESLRLSNIEQFVSELPLKMDTLVGDRGVALSGGQRQRIALARALLRKPEILLLDEATSALDSESERLIMQSIDAIAPYTTIVVVAHRLSTVARAEHLYVFSKGQIVEFGSYTHLSGDPESRLAYLIADQQLGLSKEALYNPHKSES
jgi:ABC-type bacteriocin/lantibiotic exporter with double-glycine peptidase domain